MGSEREGSVKDGIFIFVLYNRMGGYNILRVRIFKEDQLGCGRQKREWVCQFERFLRYLSGDVEEKVECVCLEFR